jgi:Flp pilus assembly protein TadD
LARRRSLTASPAIGAATLALAAGAILGAWAIWQPLRSANDDSAAIAALSRGDSASAIADGQAAAAANPLSVDPLFELSAIYGATGNQPAALHELQRAARLQPSNPATWETLGELYLRRGQARSAMFELTKARPLDPSGYRVLDDLERARIALERQQR